MPRLYAREERPKHPYIVDYSRNFNYDDYFESPQDVKKALAGYFGLVSYLDENIGKVLGALRDAGLADDTVVMYTSDHGDNLGARGLWGKSTMYEEIAGVPMILAGPGVPVGKRVATPVSHVDAFPTLLEIAGETMPAGFPGFSLVRISEGLQARPDGPLRVPRHGLFHRRLRGARRQVEVRALRQVRAAAVRSRAGPGRNPRPRGGPGVRGGAGGMPLRLYAICDPAEVDRRARARQAELLARERRPRGGDRTRRFRFYARAGNRGGLQVGGRMKRWICLLLVVFSAASSGAGVARQAGARHRAAIPPGGGHDFTARVVATRLAEVLKQPFVVENRTGASGTIATEGIAKGPADGYAFIVASPAETVVGAVAGLKMNYDWEKDLAPVTVIGDTPLAIAVHPSVAVEARSRSCWTTRRRNPGKLSYGTPGSGSSMHFAGESLKALAGIFIVHIPYRGAAPAVADLLGGQVPSWASSACRR